jgi:ATP synthase F1 delta subunit
MNAQMQILARRYARAFLVTHEKETDIFDLNILEEAKDYFQNNRAARCLTHFVMIDDHTKTEIMGKICNFLRLPAQFLLLMNLLIAHRRFSLIHFVFQEMIILLKNIRNLHEFTVTSSCEVTKEQKQAIMLFLEQKTKSNVICTYEEDRSFIAGIRLQSETRLWEDSIHGRIRLLRIQSTR